MPFDVHYLPEQHVLFQRLYGVVTLDELREINRQFRELLAQVETTLHVLVDIRAVERSPTSLSQLRSAIITSRNPLLGWVVVTAKPNKMINLIATVATQMSFPGVRFRMFDDMDRSISFLEDLQAAPNLRQVILPMLEQPPTA